MRNIFFIIALITIAACSGTKEVTVDETPTKKAPVKAAKAGCETFKNTPDEEEAKKIHVLAHDYVKVKDYENALPLWKKSYAMAPAANGATAVVYKDGVKIYKALWKKASDASKKSEYQAKILELYDARINCYPEDENAVLSQKIRDLYYDFEDKSKILTLGKRALEIGGMDASPAMFYAYADVITTGFMDKTVSKDEAINVYNKFNEIAMHNMTKSDDEDKVENYRQAWEDVAGRYEYIGAYIFDCQRYVDMYQGEFDANPTKETARALIPKLSVKGCDQSNAFYAKVYNAAYPKVTRTVSKRPTKSTSSSSSSSTADMSSAEKVAYYEGKLADASIPDSKKFSYAINGANIAYSKLGKKSKGRSLARKAAKYNPSSGKPYLVIGKIYAGSGKDCGPGTGFDSQRVVWVAIDQWRRAISTEPGSETASQAQDLINKYTQYMPTQEDGFMKGLKEGQSYTVDCWINESTKVRFK